MTPPRVVCPHCTCDDPRMLERVPLQTPTYFCNNCGKEFVLKRV